jgi:hypothetical protein
LKATYIWQIATKSGAMAPSFFGLFCKKKLWRFCAFLNTGSSKTLQKPFWGKSMSKTIAKKVEKKTFFLSFFPSIFLIAFFAVSLLKELQNTIKISKNLKKGIVVSTSLFVLFSAPLAHAEEKIHETHGIGLVCESLLTWALGKISLSFHGIFGTPPKKRHKNAINKVCHKKVPSSG